MQTLEIQLVSGFTARAGVLTGKQQRLFTQNSGLDMEANLKEVLISLVTEVGEVDLTAMDAKETDEFFARMPSADVQKLLVGIRQHSLRDDPNFTFSYEYTSKDKVREVVDIVANISGGFPTHPFKSFDQSMIAGKTKLSEIKPILNSLPVATFGTYQEMLNNLDVVLTLPDSGNKVRFTRLNGKAEKIASVTKKENLNSHVTILMRNPVFIDSGTPVRVMSNDLDKMSVLDIEVLRGVMTAVEGKVDVEYMFEHPEAKYKLPHERNVVINVLQQLSFFFPSGAM